MLDKSSSEEIFHNMQSKLLLAQFEAVFSSIVCIYNKHLYTPVNGPERDARTGTVTGKSAPANLNELLNVKLGQEWHHTVKTSYF